MGFKSFDRSKVDPWFLSGEPVVRLWGRDYDMSTDRYCEWLLELAHNYKLDVQLKKLTDPPGVIVRAYTGKAPKDKLVDPLLVVNKESMGWLFCTSKDCSNRLAEGMPPGGVCPEHLGKR